mgnify:FL=1
MQKLARDIKERDFKNVYLLTGEEDYLRKQYRDRLAGAMADVHDTMNYHYFEGKNTIPEKLIDLAETMPFLAERRVIVVENSGFFKSAQDKLADYLKQLPETSFFIFVEPQVDKRGRLYKACKDVGYIAEFNVQDEQTLRRWILGRLNKEQKLITERALAVFMERTGSDMENIASELEKLLCYTLEKPDITEADVDAICTRQINNRIFDMIEAVASKRQEAALELYYDLLALKEPPMRILFLIARQYNLLYQTKLLKGKGYDNKSIASKLGLSPFIAGKYVTQASRFEKETLRKSLEQCVEAEENVKTGKMADNLSVELLIVQFSSKKSQRKEA